MPTRTPKAKTNARKRPTAAERKAANEARAAAQAATPDEPPPEGVLVRRILLEDGVNYGFQVLPVGDVRATEIGDILAYGLRDHRKRTDPE